MIKRVVSVQQPLDFRTNKCFQPGVFQSDFFVLCVNLTTFVAFNNKKYKFL
jgi:hypothetical protein